MATREDLLAMGFDAELVDSAIRNVNGDVRRAVEFLLGSVDSAGSGNAEPSPQNQLVVHPTANQDTPGDNNIGALPDCDQENTPAPLYDRPAGPARAPGDETAAASGATTSNAAGNSFDADVGKAIELSLLNSAREVEDPTLRARSPGIPVGLKNVGNTCYFNTMLQGYFAIAPFRNFVLSLELHHGEERLEQEDQKITLLMELQELFAYMLMTERKYADPSKVIKSMLANANREIGAQEDPTEYSVMFLEAVQDGLKAYRQMMRRGSMPASGDGEELSMSQSSFEESRFMEGMFSAKEIEKIQVRKDDGTVETRVQEAEFNQIIVNIGEGNLYDALESYTSEISIQTNEPGYEPHGTKFTLFEGFPPVLSICCQRLGYDKENNKAIKLNTPFAFPKTLYLDRYCDANSAEIMKRRTTLRELKQRQQQLEEQLRGLAHYNGGESGIDANLRNTIHYLQTLPQDRDMIVSTLEGLLSSVEQEMRSLRRQIDEVIAAKENMFSDMTRLRYRLHACLIHDGTPMSGHYWVFVYDAPSKKWFKHNDTSVSEVDEKVMWEESTGGHGNTSAYCLVYVDESLDVEEPNPSTVVPIILQAMIAEDNDAFKEEIKRWEANAGERELRRAEQNVVTELIQKFKDRVAVLCTTTLDERNDPRLLSFEHFLLHLGSEDVMQRTILNAVFEEQFPGESLSKTDRTAVVLQLAENLPGVVLQPSSEDITQARVLERQFSHFKLVATRTICCFIRWGDTDGNAIQSALGFLVKAFSADCDVIYSPMKREKELYRYFECLLLKLSAAAEQQLEAGNWRKGFQDGFSVATLMAQLGRNSSPVIQFLRTRWEATLRTCGTVLHGWADRGAHPHVFMKHRDKRSDILTMLRASMAYAKRYSFPAEDPPSWEETFASLYEAYRVLKPKALELMDASPKVADFTTPCAVVPPAT